MFAADMAFLATQPKEEELTVNGRRINLNVQIRQSDWLLSSKRDPSCFQSRAKLEWG